MEAPGASPVSDQEEGERQGGVPGGGHGQAGQPCRETEGQGCGTDEEQWADVHEAGKGEQGRPCGMDSWYTLFLCTRQPRKYRVLKI